MSTVDHPSHYNAHPAGIECIDVVEEMGFNVGNAIKYLWRAGLKPGVDATEDLQKAGWYVQREIDRLSKRATDATASDTEPEPWCTVDRHIVLPSGEACVCGENRMELML